MLFERLVEAAPSRIQLLTGPRQVGKTTLLFEIMQRYGKSAIYVAADSPESGLPGFWERLRRRVDEQVTRGDTAILLLDEVQHLNDWAARLKAEWDRWRREATPVHIVITGSSSLRLGEGSRESLAGRFERLTLSHWTASTMVKELAIDSTEAVRRIVASGCYPGAEPLFNDRERWRAYIADAIIEPAIGRDILALGTVRRPALLRQVFMLCASLPAQIVSLQKLQGQLQDKGALETIAHYLRLLEDAYLVASLEKYSTKAMRRRAAPPKLVMLNNALLAAILAGEAPSAVSAPAEYGRWVENACLAHAWNAGQQLRYWREEPFEVDGVIEGSWGKWALEVKAGTTRPKDLQGLLEFCRRHEQFKPLVLFDGSGPIPLLDAVGVELMTWQDYLLHGLGGR